MSHYCYSSIGSGMSSLGSDFVFLQECVSAVQGIKVI